MFGSKCFVEFRFLIFVYAANCVYQKKTVKRDKYCNPYKKHIVVYMELTELFTNKFIISSMNYNIVYL